MNYRRSLHIFASTLGLPLVFLLATAFALILHLDTPRGRRFLAAAVASALESSLRGHFTIGGVERVGLGGIVLLDVKVKDPEQRLVLTASRVRAQAAPLTILWRLLSETREVTIEVEQVEIARAEAHWHSDANGAPSIARAFTPRPTPGPADAKPTGREIRVAVRDVELRHGFARGAPLGLPMLEAEVTHVRGFVLVTPAGAEVALGRFGLVARGLGGAELRGVSSVRVRSPGYVFTAFDGHFADVQVGCVVRSDGDLLTATLDLPAARAEQLRAVLPGLPLASELEAHVELEGVPPNLTTSARLHLGDNTRAVVAGPVELGRELHAQLNVFARGVDLQAFDAALPKSELDAKGTLKLRSGSSLALDADIMTEAGTVSGVPTPPAEISATLRGGLFIGRARLHEPGLPLQASFALRPDGSADVSAETAALRLDNPRLSGLLHTRGGGSARFVAHVDHGRLTLDANADIDQLSRGTLSAAHAKLSARARGALNDLGGLAVDASFDTSDTTLSGVHFTRLSGSLKGPLRAPEVSVSARDASGASIDASARVSASDAGTRIQGLSFVARRDQAEVEGSAERLELSAERVRLSDVALRGAGGTLHGSLEFGERLVSLEAKGEKLKFGKLLQMLGLPSHFVAGEADFEADVLLARDIERGNVNVTVRNGALGPLSDVTAALHARLENRHLDADLSGEVRGLFRLAARAALDTPGSVRDAKALRDTLGEAELELADLDLTLLGRTLAPGSDPLIAGKLAMVLKAQRRAPYALPNWSLTGFSEGLELDTKTLLGLRERLSGVDARFGVNVSGESGASDVSVRLVDTRGTLASASAAMTLDWVALLAHPERILQNLWSTELAGKLLLEERSFDELPVALRPSGFTGRARAEVTLNGNIARPSLAGRARLAGVEWVEASSTPFDLCSTFGFEPASRRLGSRGELFASRQGSEPCSTRRVGQYALTTTLGPPERDFFPSQGSAVASLERAPLGAIPFLAGLGVGGFTSGNLTLSLNGASPALVANLNLEAATIHDVPIGDGRLELRSNETALGLSLDVERGNGRVQATAFAALDYSQPLPRFAPNEPIGVRVTAEHADAVVLSPFTRDLFSELGGEVDAKLTLSLRRETAANGSSTTSGDVNGDFALRDGTLELAGLGLRLFDAELTAHAVSEAGETRVDFGNITAKAGKGKESVTLQNGKIWLKGLEIARAEGTLNASELPLGVEGVQLATATTRQAIHFKIHRAEQAMRAQLDVPYLLVALPQSSARELISLDENRSIEILQPLGASRRKGGDSLPWYFEFMLGQNVKLTRSDLDLPLSGRATLILGDQLAVTGDLDLAPGGRVDVSGRTFVIESGEVHFDNGEPDNPRIRVTATWRAADGTLVTADVSGHLKDATLRLSSPGRTQQEAYALLLGSGGDGNPGAASGGVAADRLLGPLLQNTPLRRIELRTGSEKTADQRTYSTYSAAWPLGENLWFEGSYKSLASSDPAYSSSAANAWSGTVDWRFRKNWSLRTEVGTIGTGLDLVWNHRY